MAKHKKPIKKKGQPVKAAKPTSAAQQVTRNAEPAPTLANDQPITPADPKPVASKPAASKPSRAEDPKTESAQHEAPKPRPSLPKAANEAHAEGEMAAPLSLDVAAAKAPARAARRTAEAAKPSSSSDAPAAFGASSNQSSADEASNTFQTFLADMRQMASETIEQTTGAMEQLRSAKSMEEVVALQTAFMQQTFQRYTLCAQRIGQLMVAGQANLIRQEVDLFQQGRAAMRSLGSIVGKS